MAKDINSNKANEILDKLKDLENKVNTNTTNFTNHYLQDKEDFGDIRHQLTDINKSITKIETNITLIGADMKWIKNIGGFLLITTAGQIISILAKYLFG